MNHLETLVEKERLPHSMLFVGQEGVDAAYSLARKVIGSAKTYHPDLHTYHVEGKTGRHPIEKLRSLIHEATLFPHEAPKKFFIVHEAERMLPTSSNALLKTFEEPPERTVIILLTNHPEKLLPTILSRCQTFTFNTPTPTPPYESEMLSLLAHPHDRTQITHLATQLEDARKTYEDEGEGTLHFQSQVSALFEIILRVARDGEARHLNVTNLFYPDNEINLPPYEKVERLIVEARLALERSLKLSSLLEALLLRLTLVD